LEPLTELKVLHQYICIGKKLAASDEAQAVLSTVLEIDEFADPRPFLLMDGPSGVGKTQMVATLSTTKQLGSFLYFLLSPLRHPQYVYQPFVQQSQLFRQYAEADCTTLGGDTTVNNLAEAELRNCATQLKTLGYVDFLLKTMKMMKKQNTNFLLQQAALSGKVEFEAMTVQAFTDKHRAITKAVICLDEAPFLQEDKSKIPLVRFVRSLFRAVGWVTVLLGTDSSVCNMIASGGSRDEGQSSQNAWAFVVTKYPKATLETLQSKYLCLWLLQVVWSHGRFLFPLGFQIGIRKCPARCKSSWTTPWAPTLDPGLLS
jgi:hypothetical protein